jgi:hypothetical protein
MSSRDLAMSSRDLAKSRMRPGRIQQPDYAQQGPGQVHHEPDHLLLEGIMVHNDPKWNMDAGLGALVKS